MKTFLIYSLFALSLSVQEGQIAFTTAEALNVRNSPGGQVVDNLSLGTPVIILTPKGQWAEVMYFKGDDTSDAKSGWVSIQYLRRGSGSVGGNSTCETEYDTGAEVCLEVTDADISCNEDYSGDFYRSCEVEVDYRLETDYRDQSSLDVDVECETEVSYKARNSINSSDDEDESYSHTLYSHDTEYGSLDFDFSFSRYKEVYSVELDDVACDISDVELW